LNYAIWKMFNPFLAFGDFDEMGELFKELETLK
jgi:hypothetical protein